MANLPISAGDIQNVINARIPLHMRKDGDDQAQVTIPIVLALEGPPGLQFRRDVASL